MQAATEAKPLLPSVARRRRLRWYLPVALLVLAASYLLAGYYLAPRLIRWQATRWVHDNLHKSITFGAIRFDPLHFVTDLDDAAISDRGRPMVAASHVRIGLSPLSVFQSAYRLDELRVDHPIVHAVVRRNGSLNLTELVPPSGPGSGPPTAVKIEQLTINVGRLTFVDHSRALQPKAVLEPVTFSLRDFQTTGFGKGEFSLKALSERGERFSWRGFLSATPISSQGRFVISDLRSDTVYRFLSEDMPVALTRGRATIAGYYSFGYDTKGLRLSASLPKASLDDIGLRGDTLFRGNGQINRVSLDGTQLHLSGATWIPQAVDLTVRQIEVRGANIAGPALADGRAVRLSAGKLTDATLDYRNRRVGAATLSLTGLDLPVRRLVDGSIDLVGLSPRTTSQKPVTGTAPGWAAHLGEVRLANSAVHVEDRIVWPHTRVDLTGVTASASALDTDLARAVSLRFSARASNGARLSGQGRIIPATRAGDVAFTLASLPVTAIVPYFPALPKLDVRSGQLGASGIVKVAAGQAAVRFTGAATLDDFAVYETGTMAQLASWNRLSLAGIQYDRGEVNIATARLSSPSGRIALMPDGSFDVSSLMTQSQPAATNQALAQGSSAKLVTSVQASPPRPVSATAPAFPVHLRELFVDGGSIGFADYSITPNFEARVDALRGTISNISNVPNTIATIDLQGQVIDRFSPVAVKGTADLFRYDRATDVTFSFRNIELPIFNPYSGVYAGYSIAKGKLSTEFTYHIANRALQADHHVIIDQLQWGQATANKARVPWPMRLATALLKDRNGVINLTVPVKGSLDEPTFRLAPIVWKIIGNVIEKAVTAPFRLIGSLFAGAEKAQYIDFAPGSAQLPLGAGESLANLAKGLAERPGLSLDIPAGRGREEDAVVIADTRIDAVAVAKTASKDRPADFAALKPQDQRDRLDALYRLRFHSRPNFDGGRTDASDKAGKSERIAAETHWLRDQLRKSFAPTEKELEALGASRGAAIRDALLAKGDIDPMRIFIATGGPTVVEKNGLVRFELKLR